MRFPTTEPVQARPNGLRFAFLIADLRTGRSDSGSAPDKQALEGDDMEQTGRWPKLTWEQQSLCAKVRVIDEPDRLVERLVEIDPSVYQQLLTDVGLPPSSLTFASVSKGAAAILELVLAMALLAEGCVIPGCDDQSETEVVFLMFGGDLGVLPGSFCPRHVQTRTRLRKLGTFLAYTTGAALPLLAGLVANELKANVGLRDDLPRERVRRLALRSEALRRAGLHDPTPEDIARLEVNFIRHELTKYDAHLDAGANVEDIRKYTYQAISLFYPDLTDECARQYRQRTKGVLRSIFGGDPTGK